MGLTLCDGKNCSFYSALFKELIGPVKLTIPKDSQESTLKQNAFRVLGKPKLAEPIRQGCPVFHQPDDLIEVEAKQGKRHLAIKAGQENIEIKRFLRLGENPPAWQGIPIKVDDTGRTDPRTKSPIYEVNDGHHRFVYQALGTGFLNLDVRENLATDTTDQWSKLEWLVEKWGKKGMTLEESKKFLEEREHKRLRKQKTSLV